LAALRLGENRQRRRKIDYRSSDPSLGTIRHDYALEADPQEANR